MILGNYTKQPSDRLDYDVDYEEWLTSGDSLISATATVDLVETSGLTIDAPMISGTRVKLWANDGVSGHSYKVTVTTTTDQGRVKQDEVRIKVKDY